MSSQRERYGIGPLPRRVGRRRLGPTGMVVTGIAASSLLLVACSGGLSTAGSPVVAKKADKIITAPAGLQAGGEPQPSGFMWVLAGTGATKTIDQLTLGSESAGKVQRILPVSLSASTLAESSSGLIVLGQATATTGAVTFLNGARARSGQLRSVPRCSTSWPAPTAPPSTR